MLHEMFDDNGVDEFFFGLTLNYEVTCALVKSLEFRETTVRL
jgi:hypothetical protein